MSKTKTKATASTIPAYHDFKQGKITRNGNEYSGWFYTLSARLTDEKKEELKAKYNNVAFFISESQYAPEIKHNVLFVADNKLK